MTGWTPPSPLIIYHKLMACHLVELYKRSGMQPIGIGKSIHWALAKLVVREAGEHENTAYGNLQMCTGLESGTEGGTHAMGERRGERGGRLEEVN